MKCQICSMTVHSDCYSLSPNCQPMSLTLFIILFPGHTRQGMKCKICRMNVHPDCQSQAPKCQPKSRLLLRRQRSASELESSGAQRMQFGSGGGHQLEEDDSKWEK